MSTKALESSNEILNWWNREKERLSNFLVPIIAITVGFLVAAFMIAASGKNPFAAYSLLFRGAIGGSFQEIITLKVAGEGLLKGAILTLTGLSVAVAFNVGLFNIGAEGQFIIGAIVAAYLGFKFDISPWINFPIIFVAVAVISGLYGAFAGWLKIKKGVHEVITTIMLNWIAINLVENWLVVGPFSIEKYQPTSFLAGTPYVKASSRLTPFFTGTRLNASIIIAIIAVIFVYLLLSRTVLGYEIRATGKNPKAARYAGINTGKAMVTAMFISGALAGISGACMILGTEGRYPGVFRPGYGFDGITMALIGGNGAIGTFVAAMFFGLIRGGATGMQLMGIHKTFTDIIQGVATLFVAGQFGIKFLLYKIGERKPLAREVTKSADD